MNWEALGALAEIIGAVAVVITLVYLSIQTRQSRIAAQESATFAKLEATGSAASAYARWRGVLINNPEVVAAITKANNNEDLTKVEQIQVAAAFEELFIACHVAYLNAEASSSVEKTETSIHYLVKCFRANPSAIREWINAQELMELVSANFVSHVNQAMKKAGISANLEVS